MRKNIFVFAAVLLFVQSCVISSYTTGLDKKIRDLKLGMDQRIVVSLLGDLYKVSSAMKLDNGITEEVYQYQGYSDGTYDLVFREGKLVEWMFVKNEVQRKTEMTIVKETETK